MTDILNQDKTFCPRVSIVIPVYNGSNYMREAIDSALAQTYPNLEVIVVNDGSTDGGATREIALSYGDRIRYLEKENGGVSSALNCGIRSMTGEYLSWLSHDDLYLPEKVAASVALLSAYENRERLIAFCGSSHINEKSEVTRSEVDTFESGRLYTGLEMLEYLLCRKMLNCCCMLIPREAFEVCGYFHEDLRYNQDALMLYHIFSHGFGFVADTDSRHVCYRLHALQTSKTRRDLLLRDSYEVSKIIAPVFLEQSPDGRLLRYFAKGKAIHDCKQALEECIRVGRESGAFSGGDVLRLRMTRMYGKLRNLLKAVYRRLRF